ncbi:MAG: VWA domain-containing protein, partial [Terrimicrobiaceae bacterium]
METSPLTFSQPVWFLALAIVPVVAGLYVWSQRRSDALLSKVVAPRLRAQLAGAASKARRNVKAALILAVFGLMAVALARPQWGFNQREVKQRGRDVIVAIDTSRSMLATDVAPSRLSRAKLVAQDLLRLVHGDRIGLVAFAGSAFLQAPLTLDYNAVLASLDELDATVIPKGGTNIAEAIRTAEQAFGKGEGQSRALIILTDGEELDADGVSAAKRAASLGVRIFTVGIGSGEGSLIPLRTEEGGADFVRDASGKPVQSRLDEKRLREIA